MKRSTAVLVWTAIAAALITLGANVYWPPLFPALAHMFDCEPSTVMWIVGICIWASFHSGASSSAANSSTIDKD